MTHIRGRFDITLTPLPAEDGIGDPTVGRMSFDKRFHGPLAAVSMGQMLAVRTAVKESAGYVAMERVVGTLDGKRGSFALQHSGTMDRGGRALVVTVVPDSGTDALTGLAGTMDIEITDGQHFYAFDYTLK